jgi:hypothetical protein
MALIAQRTGVVRGWGLGMCLLAVCVWTGGDTLAAR